MSPIIPLGELGKLFLMTSISLQIVTCNPRMPFLPKGKFASEMDQTFSDGGTPPWVHSQLKNPTSFIRISIYNQNKISGILYGDQNCG
jgi:DNA replication protein DnaC